MKNRIVCSLLAALLLCAAAAEASAAEKITRTETRLASLSFVNPDTGEEFFLTPEFSSSDAFATNPYYVYVPYSVTSLTYKAKPLSPKARGIMPNRTLTPENKLLPFVGGPAIPLEVGENLVLILALAESGDYAGPGRYQYHVYLVRASASGDAPAAPAQNPATAPPPMPSLPKTIIKPPETDAGATLSVNESIDPGSMPFVDVLPSHWFRNNVAFVYGYGMMKGTGATTFEPDTTMSRAMIITALARAAGVDTSVGDNWYSAAVEWAQSKDVYDGYDPTGNLTRQELALFMWRVAGKPESAPNTEFNDNSSITVPSRTAVSWAVSRGVCNGYPDGSFKPNNSVTRAEVAAILYRYICSEYL